MSPSAGLAPARRQLGAIEINGTAHSLQKPESFRKWREATPEGFRFAVKGSSYVTNRKVLASAGESLAKFFAQGLEDSCREAFGGFRLPLAISAAILTELFHLLGDNPTEHDTAWRFIRSGAVSVLAIVDEDVPRLEALMRKYHDRPMDFADATLVHLAERESLSTVFTIDHDDFETYRIGGRARFRILPSR